MNQHFFNFFRGLAMGTAEGIPGVSGSTLALLLGIYDRFIKLLHDVSVLIKTGVLVLVGQKKLSDVKSSFAEIEFSFAIPLGLGTVVALSVFALIIDSALETYPMQVYAIFVGLTIASVAIPLKSFPLKLKYLVAMLTTFLVVFLFFEVAPGLSLSSNGFTPLYIFAAGFLAISGMIFPGVSGSFILLMLGLYQYIYTGTVRAIISGEIDTQRLIDFGIFVLGVIAGFMILVKVVKKALETKREMLMAIVAGVLLASIRVLWPLMLIEEGKQVSEFAKLSVFEVEGSILIQVVVIIILAAGLGLLLVKAEGTSAKD